MRHHADTVKLQKALAQTGLGSRRALETWIVEGRVTVNGKIAQLGERVTANAKVTVDGKLIKLNFGVEVPRLLLYHKPVGEICSRHDPNHRPTVFASLPSLKTGRWIGVGRLDINTSGLLLFTNDGSLAHHLMHPSTNIEREYAVRVLGDISPETLSKLRTGVMLEDGSAYFASIVRAGGQGANIWYHVVLKEGRYREVKRLFESQQLVVSRLIRIRFGPVLLPRDLRPKTWIEILPQHYFKEILK